MKKPIDTLNYKIIESENHLEDKHITVEIIKRNDKDLSVFENPYFSSLIFPLAVTLITFFITRFLLRKREKSEIAKIEADVEKNRAEIAKIESSYQPIVVASLQTIQNEILKDKVISLKSLVESKLVFFSVQQKYYQGENVIDDSYEYYNTVYNNFNDEQINHLKKNSLTNGVLFPDTIRVKFNLLIFKLEKVKEVRTKEFSLNEHSMPVETEKLLGDISLIFEDLIDLIRQDLHLNNTFIHDFVSKYQRLDSK